MLKKIVMNMQISITSSSYERTFSVLIVRIDVVVRVVACRLLLSLILPEFRRRLGLFWPLQKPEDDEEINVSFNFLLFSNIQRFFQISKNHIRGTQREKALLHALKMKFYSVTTNSRQITTNWSFPFREKVFIFCLRRVANKGSG